MVALPTDTWRIHLLRATRELLVALVVSCIAAVAITWPLATDLHHQVVGGGELGGWIWRMWWHFQEVRALAELDLGPAGLLRQLVGLGRFPETGNILDILLLSYPLHQLFGFPQQQNVKVLLILVGNGLAAYALARSVTEHRGVALVASLVAIANPLVIQDINRTGLRQVLLWWVLLFPIGLRRALRTASPFDGVLVGLLFTAISAFYWFYGLFTMMYAVPWVIGWALRHRSRVHDSWRWGLPAAAVAVVGVALFLQPYFHADSDVGPDGASVTHATLDLPETTFLLPFPDYDVIALAPARPSTAAENLVASLHRVIESSWPADYVVNPLHGPAGFPLVVVLLGVLPGVLVRKARPWLGIWLLFWLGTLGPFLKWGTLHDAIDVVHLGRYVVRLPFVWMFQFIPGMSRMFAPYRMSSMMVMASVPLLALGLSNIQRRGMRLPVMLVAVAGMAIQPCLQRTPSVAAGAGPRTRFRLPATVGTFSIPSWYRDLDAESTAGIVELPLEQQQDLLAAYQSFHGRPVYRQNWANRAALPPLLRRGGGPTAAYLRALADPDHDQRDVEQVLLQLSRDPQDTDLNSLPPDHLAQLVTDAGYRWLVVHESGFLYVDAPRVGLLYETALYKLTDYLGQQPMLQVEFQAEGSASDAGLPLWVPPARLPPSQASPAKGPNRPTLELGRVRPAGVGEGPGAPTGRARQAVTVLPSRVTGIPCPRPRRTTHSCRERPDLGTWCRPPSPHTRSCGCF